MIFRKSVVAKVRHRMITFKGKERIATCESRFVSVSRKKKAHAEKTGVPGLTLGAHLARPRERRRRSERDDENQAKKMLWAQAGLGTGGKWRHQSSLYELRPGLSAKQTYNYVYEPLFIPATIITTIPDHTGPPPPARRPQIPENDKADISSRVENYSMNERSYRRCLIEANHITS